MMRYYRRPDPRRRVLHQRQRGMLVVQQDQGTPGRRPALSKRREEKRRPPASRVQPESVRVLPGSPRERSSLQAEREELRSSEL